METIDLIRKYNRIYQYSNLGKLCNDNVIAFELQEYVPLGALSFHWTRESNRTLFVNYHIEKSHPLGINYNFENSQFIYPYDANESIPVKQRKKLSACLSYFTMPFMHKYGFMDISRKLDTSFDVDDFLRVFYKNKLVGFAEIPYDVYITALHIYNTSNDIISNNDFSKSYITEEDVRKLDLKIEDMNFVFDSSFERLDLFYDDHEIKNIDQEKISIKNVDDLYFYITGRKIEQQNNNKIFEYE